ncbi:MAG: TIGR00730 family Rossman fold protein [Gammaproteobacteria bacterium]|nr:TIGR00730 family Rossman fold protein [Gammaproteobacteria bacterium]MDD9895777.1 TIGR00730 family Rossman fold protein [Gammaproteobacteria bacterium]MDD9959908.1 TIGR00730 family Rossman fold protein [Gammaproteobacteria bacterium]
MKRICVYCGSAAGANPVYVELAEQLAAALVAKEIGLVYGGAQVGLMGAIANSVLALGGSVTGILPVGLFRTEVPHAGLTELIEVNSLHERKAKMAEISDGFIAMPGGLGTLEELFEILTWLQLGLHRKPVGLLNVSKFFDKLLEYLDHAVAEKFIRLQHREMIVVDTDINSMLQTFENYQAPSSQKWVDLADR